MSVKKIFCVLAMICSGLVFSLEIYRPENYGHMNDIPCLLRITDMDGNDAWDRIISLDQSWYYDMQTKPHWTHKYYRGSFRGGAVLHLNMQEGTYLISVYTPVDLQDGMTLQNDGEWTSNTFVYKTGAPALKVIFISPTANQNGFYTGGWHVDYRAPKYFKYTKPYRGR